MGPPPERQGREGADQLMFFSLAHVRPQGVAPTAPLAPSLALWLSLSWFEVVLVWPRSRLYQPRGFALRLGYGWERRDFGVLWSLCQALGVLNPVLRVRLSLCVLSGLAACILAFASVNFS
jgi:hypothetical protein